MGATEYRPTEDEIITTLFGIVKHGGRAENELYTSLYAEMMCDDGFKSTLGGMIKRVARFVTDDTTPEGEVIRFKKAYDAVARGSQYVPIYKVRRELQWDEAKFDQCFDHMMVRGHIAAHPGNVAEMVWDDAQQCFWDIFGDFYATVSWRGYPEDH